MARHGGGRERFFGGALGVLAVVARAVIPVALDPVSRARVQAAPTQVASHAPEGMLEHLAHLARPEVAEIMPAERGAVAFAVLAEGAVEEDDV